MTFNLFCIKARRWKQSEIIGYTSKRHLSTGWTGIMDRSGTRACWTGTGGVLWVYTTPSIPPALQFPKINSLWAVSTDVIRVGTEYATPNVFWSHQTCTASLFTLELAMYRKICGLSMSSTSKSSTSCSKQQQIWSEHCKKWQILTVKNCENATVKTC